MPLDGQGPHIRLDSALRLPRPRLAESLFCADGVPIPVLTDEALFDACATRIAFTSRQGGVSGMPFDALNLSYAVGDSEEAVDANRRALLAAMGRPDFCERIVSPVQVHGSAFYDLVDPDDACHPGSCEADGVLCTLPDVPVLLCFADCVPVILVAPGGSFAVAHSGWRGSIAGIAGLALGRLVSAVGCAPGEVNCYIGPHIGSCCYEVADELVGRFVAEFGQACDAGACHLDLSAAVRQSLVRAGAMPDRITDAGICTSCHHDRYYSYRVAGGVTGRHGAFCMRKGETWD